MQENKNAPYKNQAVLLMLIFFASTTLIAQERRIESQSLQPPPPPIAADTQLFLPPIDIEYLQVIQGVKYALPLCDYLFEHLNEIPEFSNHLFEAFSKSQGNISELFHYTNSILGSKAGGYGPPLSGSWKGNIIKTEDDIDDFFKLEDVNVIHPEEWNKLPFYFKKGIIEFLFYAKRAKSTIDQYIDPVVVHLNLKGYNSQQDILEKLMSPWTSRELDSWGNMESIQLVDEKKLSYASRIASEKLNWFFTLSNLSVPDDFSKCSITCDMGECVISGTANDTIRGNNFCVIELGGDDVYLGNTASPISVQHPIGIVIDLKGSDKYLCRDELLVSGVLGLAFLLDLEGDDTYLTNQPGLSFSLYGTSLLYDLKGDDVFITKSSYAQASSFVGTSLFVDVSGKDKYSSLSYSQGFGGTKGVAVFYDGDGNDYYNTGKAHVSFTEQPLSFIQGAAKGRWAEATDGQSLAGGIGIFFDNAGTDHYRAGSFSQGASYYFGFGVFSDKRGNDKYNSNSHSQGYAAHYSLASFIEKHGDDRYNCETDTQKITQIIGGGRDNSAGLFIDYYGNDKYNFGNRSAGIGDLNGIGCLQDLSGNDSYNWHKNRINAGSPSIGKTIGEGIGMGLTFKVIPQPNHATGLFYDSNGDDASRK
ncbi:hypothetical protein [uncultured Draconibacterium sp.]|uniref:hypothetical protein n=1 Tax=uncultured Draconibacterium sp. TaxID=1573823 RepID=UPI0029C90B52|nr:hypothetical protein [uncultured Draconibacterium sp.]